MKYFSTKAYIKDMLDANLIDSVVTTKCLETWAVSCNGMTNSLMRSYGYMLVLGFLSNKVETLKEAFDYIDQLLKDGDISSEQHTNLNKAMKRGQVNAKGLGGTK